jgi:hypothetical protein
MEGVVLGVLTKQEAIAMKVKPSDILRFNVAGAQLAVTALESAFVSCENIACVTNIRPLILVTQEEPDALGSPVLIDMNFERKCSAHKYCDSIIALCTNACVQSLGRQLEQNIISKHAEVRAAVY